MNFHLKFNIPESPVKIGLKDKILLMGSCFSDEIGNLLVQNKFKAWSNPFGTIYNPLSIFELLHPSNSLSDSVFENQGIWYSWGSHSRISSPDRNQLIQNVEETQKKLTDYITELDWIIITFGTSWVYKLKGSRKIVANCHKVPQNQFDKELLNQEEIHNSFREVYSTIKSLNPNVKFILTVSPVRHIKDGLIENNHSKSILLDTVHRIHDEFENIYYFPSYEIVIDELRDYRFFRQDLIHPNEQAVNYIWERFCQTYFEQETMNFIHNWKKLLQAISHKPFHPESDSHQDFLKKTKEKLLALANYADLSEELNQIDNQLKK